jgi:hypothetical protein
MPDSANSSQVAMMHAHVSAERRAVTVPKRATLPCRLHRILCFDRLESFGPKAHRREASRGSYMNPDVLREVNLVPADWEVARLHGFDISIRPRANLVRSEQHARIWASDYPATGCGGSRRADAALRSPLAPALQYGHIGVRLLGKPTTRLAHSRTRFG